VELDCLDPCSSLEITQQVLYYKSLANMCSVKCALTFNEIVETIVNRTESTIESGTEDKTWTAAFGTKTKAVHHQLVINARFYNANPDVRDIIVKFRYNVAFKGEEWIYKIIISQLRPWFAGSGSGNQNSGTGTGAHAGSASTN
jgi:hypothetical protein